MAITISVDNQKGGVAKTTTAAALISGLSLKGHKVLGVDLDSQANLTYTTGADKNAPGALEILTGEIDARDAIQHTDAVSSFISANSALFTFDRIVNNTGKEYRLKNALEGIQGEYDYIIIDTPPALNLLTTNALTASDYVIIPAQADIYSIEGVNELAATIERVRQHSNPELKIAGILLTRYNPRTLLTQGVTRLAENTANQIGTRLFHTKIREAVAIKEAQLRQESIFTFLPKAKVTEDYHAFIEELLRIVSEGAVT